MLNKFLILISVLSFSSFAFATKKPVAVIRANPTSGYLPLTVSFDGTGSYDPDGTITSYSWNFGDGNSSTSSIVEYTYTSGKKKDKVRLTVTDNSGKKSEEKLTIDFLQDNTPPVLNFDVPDNFTVNINTPTITALYSDATSKVDLNTVYFFLDNVDVTNKVVKSASHAVLQFTNSWPLTPGQHTLKVVLQDYYGNTSSRLISIFNASEVSSSHYLNGRVIDIQGIPVEGALVQSIDGPTGSVLNGYTNTEGKFSLKFTVGGDYKLLISKNGYLDTFKYKSMLAGVDQNLEPVVVDLADTKKTFVTAAAGGNATNSTGSISLSIPAGSMDSDKQLYFTEAKTGKSLSIPLPFASHFTYANNNQPTGTVFSEPADMSIANILGFDPGFEIPVGTTDEQLGIWVDTGYKGVVRADGTRIDFKVAHFSDKDINLNTASDDNQEPPETEESDENANPKNKECDCEPGSRINAISNELHLDYDLPVVMRKGKNHALSFTYSSQSANPVSIITTKSLSVPEVTNPSLVELTGNFAGIETNKKYVGEVNNTVSILSDYAELKGPEGYYYNSGVFGYFWRVRAMYQDGRYYTATPYFGGPGNRPYTDIQVSEPVILEDYFNGDIVHQNQIYSKFGAGWTLNGLEKLTVMDWDKKVLWEDGTGFATFFTPGAIMPGKKMKQTRVNADTENLHYSKGFFYGASCSGNEVFRIDLKGRYTTLLSNTKNKNLDLNCPTSVFQSRKGGLYISDSGNKRIIYLEQNGKFYDYAGGKNKQSFNNPTFVSEDNVLAVHVIDENEIKTVSPFNKDVLTIVSHDSDFFKANLIKPTQIHYDFYHNLVVVDEGKGEIVKFFMNNNSSRVILKGVKGLKAMTFDPIVNRYFLLDNKGKVYHWKGQGHKRVIALNEKSNSFGSDISSIAFSPEIGLTYINQNGLQFTDPNSKSSDIQLYISQAGTFSSLQRNADGTFTKTEVDKSVTQFDENGYITSRFTTSDNSTTSYEYDDSHRVTKINLPKGGSYTFDYYGWGNLEKITDPSGKVTRFYFDDKNNLVEMKNAELNSELYAYDSKHLLTSKTDTRGLTTNYEYKLGRVSRIIYPGDRIKDVRNGLVEHLLQGPVEGLYQRLAPEEAVTDFTSPENRLKQYIVDQYGLTKGNIDGNGNRTYIMRNSDTKPIEFSSAEGRKEYVSYDSYGRTLTKINGEGEFTFGYDPISQRVSSISDKNFRSEHFGYSPSGLLTFHSDRNGVATNYEYNLAEGLLNAVRDSFNNRTVFTRDEYGNVSGITDPTGQKTTFSRDVAGNLVSQTDSLGNTTSFDYDDMNRVSKITDAKNGQTTFSYLPTGELETVIDARGYSTTFSYNEQNEVSKILNHLNQEVNFSYDNDGNVLSKITKANQTINYTYDGNNNLLTKVSPSDSTSFAYDADNLVTELKDNDSRVIRSYDLFGRLKTESSEHYTGFIDWTYNKLAQNSNTKININNETAIFNVKGHDANGNLISSTGYFYGKAFSFQKTLDGLNRLSVLRYPNGSTSSINYDANSRPVDMTTNIPGIHYMDYRYTANGDISIVYEEINQISRPNRYEYDVLNRLVGEQSIVNRSYVYDALGNNLNEGGQFNELNQLLEDNNFTYQYDLNGNLTRKTNKVTGSYHSFTWNSENQMTQAKSYKNASTLQFTIAYKYDASGRRIFRSVTNHLDTTKSYSRKFIYEGQNIAAILDGNNDQFIAGYMYDDGIDEPVVLVTDYNKDGQLDGLSIVRDRQNSVKLLVNEKQEIVQEISYSAYGETQILNRSQKNPITNNIFYYTSRELEPELGIYYYRARYYDPGTGRFLSEDPIGFSSSDANFYRFVLNRPVLMTDPRGEFAVLPWLYFGFLYILSADDPTTIYKDGRENPFVKRLDIKRLDKGNKLDEFKERNKIKKLLKETEDKKNLKPGSCKVA